jgi:hypothetical protein
VTGNVAIRSAIEFAVEGAGTSHRQGMRHLALGRPTTVQVANVEGDVDLHYGRVRLDLADIAGQINVTNEFGDTSLALARPLSAAAHRIYTLSGRIDAELTSDAWNSLPIVAVTNHGSLRTNVDRQVLDEFHLQGEDSQDGMRRTFAGFRSVVPGEDRFAALQLLDRFGAISGDTQRSDGLDLFSRAGIVLILRK